MNTRADQEQMVQDCIDRESQLTDWERKFIDDVERVLRNGGRLTPAQDEKLDEIWERVT